MELEFLSENKISGQTHWRAIDISAMRCLDDSGMCSLNFEQVLIIWGLFKVEIIAAFNRRLFRNTYSKQTHAWDDYGIFWDVR